MSYIFFLLPETMGSCFTFNCQCCFPSLKTAVLIQPQISKVWPWQPPVVLLSVAPHGLDCVWKLASWRTLAHLQEGLMSVNLIMHTPYIWTALGWIAMNWVYHTDFGASPAETLCMKFESDIEGPEWWNDPFLSCLCYLCVKWSFSDSRHSDLTLVALHICIIYSVLILHSVWICFHYTDILKPEHCGIMSYVQHRTSTAPSFKINYFLAWSWDV